jgi:glucose-1-phosphate cytidylyltransferase
MKAVILAGGFGTRISEETHLKPKPMIEIGGMPVLWHIMKIYASHGINEFIICCGYKGYLIKEYFSNYALHMSDVTINTGTGAIAVHKRCGDDWEITLVDTGEATLTGGRLKRIQSYVENDDAFCLTYGDGLSNVNITELIKFHFSHRKMATLTAVQPPGRFGVLQMSEARIVKFNEKPDHDGNLINGGFFVISPKCLSLINSDDTSWEGAPLEELANSGQLMAYKHTGFWQPMDTLRDKNYLDALWHKGSAPWRIW